MAKDGETKPPRSGTLTGQGHGDKSSLAPGERDRMMAEFKAEMAEFKAEMAAKRRARRGKAVDDYFGPPKPTRK